MNPLEMLAELHDLIVSSTEPTTMDNGDPLLDATIWLDTGSTPWLWKRYDKSGTQWVIVGVFTLDHLTDVDVTTTPPTDQQALLFDEASSLWVPGDVASGGGGGGGGGLARQYLGINVEGASALNMVGNRWYSLPVTIPDGGGFLASIDVFVQGTDGAPNTLRSAVHADVGGEPEDLLAGSDANAGNSVFFHSVEGGWRWYTMPIGRWLEAGDYWIGVTASDAGGIQIAYDAGTTGGHYDSSGGWIMDAGGQAFTAGTADYSIRALLLTAASQPAFENALVHVQDEKASGTNGGDFTSGAWRTRDLNTVKTNEVAGASLASNQLTLPAGEYYCEWRAPAGLVNRHQSRLYDTTAATEVMPGSGEYSGGSDAVTNRSTGSGRFTLGAESVLEVQHQCQTSRSNNGFGNQGGFASGEVYTVLKVWKVG